MPDAIKLPEAQCPTHATWLTFERCPYRAKWTCYCNDCVDGEYDHESGSMRALNTVGVGATPLEALEYYADAEDVDPNEILFTEEKHV